MPRTARVVVPEFPHHIVQRGHNRQAVFVTDADFRYYLSSLLEFKELFEVKVYAYCLMTNHVHLLLTPACQRGLGQLMKRLAGRQTRYCNKQEGRRGTLWEGRYKSSLVDKDNYLLTCVRYIELNPMRAGMVAQPKDYPWSSYTARFDRSGKLLDPVPGLGRFLANQHDYQSFTQQAISDPRMQLIRDAVQRGQLTGDATFIEQIDNAIGRRIEHRRPGQPAKNGK